MAKGAYFPKGFWDSAFKDELWRLPHGHLRVFLHLAYGPTAHLSGIYRISVPAIAEDVEMEPEEVWRALRDLEKIGWCDVEYPLIWIRGTGNILDKLGTARVSKNPAWVTSTTRHLDELPQQNRLVYSFRGFHGILGESGGEAPPQPIGVSGGYPLLLPVLLSPLFPLPSPPDAPIGQKLTRGQRSPRTPTGSTSGTTWR